MSERIPPEADIVVVGAGLAGLTTGVVAARAGCRVLVLGGRAPGGRAAVTTVTGHDGRTVGFNGGPRALYTAGAGSRVLDALGIRPAGAVPRPKPAWARVGDRFELLPDRASSLLRTGLVPARSKPRLARALTSLRRVDPAPLAHLSARDWVSQVVGGDDDLVPALSALVRLTTYEHDLERLSADAAALQLTLALTGGVKYLDNGFQQLVDALVDRGRDVGMGITRQSVEVISQTPGGYRVDTDAGSVATRSVVLAAGSPAAADRLLGTASGGPSDAGRSCTLTTAACLELAVATRVERQFVLGIDEPLYLSVHCPPAGLAPAGVEVVHLMRYGARTSTEDRAQLEALARAAGIRDGDVLARRFLHAMVVNPAMPVASQGGLGGRPPVGDDARPGLFLAGDSVGAEGLLADAAFASGLRAGNLAVAAGTRTPAAAAAAVPVTAVPVAPPRGAGLRDGAG